MTPNNFDKSGVRRGPARILLVDDEADVRETTGKVLTRLGYIVAFAKSGEDAVELYRKEKEAGSGFDLVIVDLIMPGRMGGEAAVRKLLEVDPHVKAIVSSGYSNHPVVEDFRNYGFAGVVNKPYRLKELSDEVSRVLSLPA